MSESETVQIPDFVVRQVGALQLQLAAAQEEAQQLARRAAVAEAELAALKSGKPEPVAS